MKLFFWLALTLILSPKRGKSLCPGIDKSYVHLVLASGCASLSVFGFLNWSLLTSSPTKTV